MLVTSLLTTKRQVSNYIFVVVVVSSGVSPLSPEDVAPTNVSSMTSSPYLAIWTTTNVYVSVRAVEKQFVYISSSHHPTSVKQSNTLPLDSESHDDVVDDTEDVENYADKVGPKEVDENYANGPDTDGEEVYDDIEEEEEEEIENEYDDEDGDDTCFDLSSGVARDIGWRQETGGRFEWHAKFV
jgi:hypothetical protein